MPPPIITRALPPLPWALRAKEHRPYLVSADPGPAVSDFAAALLREARAEPLAFLDALTLTLFRRTDRRIRETGFAQTPAETLTRAEGACRDLAILFLACCRGVGLPGRFASGYQAHAESVDGQRHLHAWPEVWLPGVGWLGFDPTHGLRVGDGHVAVYAAPTQEETMPVEGGYYGLPTGARLDYRVEITIG
ncbi:transglutaminase family protein [Salipiger sp. 1_MG-2023]|uniref:transglutaminase-like domain-containing protein n=1 Tax=Salipiger sp. 1_MG-2023 TaxID=3062665 RepID=UPI0026E1FF07|nr:transglutaminase family protein [Salipiger sp. 1_MG-2023]MDO6586590.1 transglutaminase family protein [Salipiger sp. 1_MG-2023]